MHSNFVGFLLRLPLFIQIGCILLLVITLGAAVRLRFVTARFLKQIRSLQEHMDLAFSDAKDNKGGISEESWDELQNRMQDLPSDATLWWNRIRTSVELYPSSTNQEGYFLVESAEDILPYEDLVKARINVSGFRALPGLLTGAGLALTFIAILFALYGVHYDKANVIDPISGIDVLINGLSGKFASSVVALGLSILFTIYEQRRMRATHRGYTNLVETIRRAIPKLSPSRILLDIRKASSDASVEVAHISAEVVERFTHAFNMEVVPNLSQGMAEVFAGSFQQQITPILEKMTGALDELKGAIVGLESNKQESITTEFERLLAGLNDSVTSALSGMAERFHEALSGSARQEFGNVQSTLEGTRNTLEAMSTKFELMQATFSGVVTRAEEATLQQLKTGREQTDALAAAMSDLVENLRTSAAGNLQIMQVQLTGVVDELVSRVGDLSSEMMRTAQHTSEQSRQAATTLVERSEESSRILAERMLGIVESIEKRAADFEKASSTLRDAQQFISALLNQNGQALQELTAASREVKEFTGNLRQQGQAMEKLTGGQLAIATQLTTAAEMVQAVMERQDQNLQRYENTIREFERVMSTLDQQIASILTAFNQGSSDYQQGVRNNFDSIVEAADKLVPRAVELLQGRIQEFAENLTEFSERLIAVDDRNREILNGKSV